MSMRYEDFTIQIGPRRGDDGHPVRVLSSPAGEGAGLFHPPFEGDVVGPLLQGGVRSGRSLRSAATVPADVDRHLSVAWGDGLERDGSDSPAHDLGDRLFRALFSGQIQTLYDQSLGAVRSQPGCGLRLKLKLDTGERELGQLSSLPWELLWRRETEDFLSLSRLSPLVRYLDVPRPASPIKVRSKLRILVAVASPQDLPPLAMEAEKTLLKDAWRRWKNVEVKFLDQANPQTLRQALLEETFHALHFIGHGGFDAATGEGVLFFERGDGKSEPASGRALATMLKDFKNLGLIFLNACETARASAEGARPFSGVANALVLGGLPAVIAMQFPISDQAAIAFSAAFYQRLATGDPIDAAVVEGRQAVLAAVPGTLEWGTPVLFLRVPDANIFHVAGRRRELSSEDREERRPRIGWLSAAAAILMAAVLGIAVTPVLRQWISPAAQEAPKASEGYRIELSQAFDSTMQGFSGALTRIEILPNGRMRLFFKFRNHSRQNVGLGFNYRSSYLADKNGNRYRMLAADGKEEAGETAVDQVQPGSEIERWFEFSAPLEQARSFKVGLMGYEGGPGFPLFEIELPDYPKDLSVSPPPPPVAAESAVLPVSRSFATSIQGLRSQLERVELLANGRMRWRFAFLNGSERDQTLGFDYSRIYLEDKAGHRYPVLSFDTGAGAVYRELVQRAVRVDRWIEFSAPLNGARDFTVVLVSHDRRTLRFIPFTVRIPYYPAKYSRTVASASQTQPSTQPTEMAAAPPALLAENPVESQPLSTEPAPAQKEPLEPPAASIPYKADTVWNTSIEGLQGSLQALELLDGNRVRWTIELQNQTGTAQEIGFNLTESYLSDNLGHRYTVVRSDAERLHREVIPAGGRITHWFEFPSPASGASRFIAVLSSHSPSTLRYRPFQIDLPKAAKPK
jgi:hypothetical protein